MRTLGPKVAAARAAGTLSRLSGRGGTSLPGKVLLRLQPDAIGALAARLGGGSAVISATNGKTTTSAMAASILERTGRRLVHNRAGANMAGGIAAALIDGDGDTGLFEVDEFWLDQVVAQLRPRALVLGNLFRDQLDRYGELDAIAERWQAVTDSLEGRPVLNADDPLVADLGRERPDALFFGVQDDGVALAEMQHASDAKHCRRCGAPYVYDAHYLGHLGRYHCERCGARRPEPSVVASDVRFEGVAGTAFTLRLDREERAVRLPLPGLYNVYNALAAAAMATSLEIGLPEIVSGLEATKAAFGRAETMMIGGPTHPREMRILLVKNPAGANEVLRTLALEPGEHDLLGVLNDRIADGRDVSWIWDADFELLAGRVRRVTCSGTRAPELALRLKYAGIDPALIQIQTDLPSALREAAADGSDPQRPLYALPTYTAMLALRELLVARGEASSAWS